MVSAENASQAPRGPGALVGALRLERLPRPGLAVELGPWGGRRLDAGVGRPSGTRMARFRRPMRSASESGPIASMSPPSSESQGFLVVFRQIAAFRNMSATGHVGRVGPSHTRRMGRCKGPNAVLVVTQPPTPLNAWKTAAVAMRQAEGRRKCRGPPLLLPARRVAG